MGRNFRKWTIRISIVLFGALLVLFCIAELMIGLGVRRFSQIAQEQFPGKRFDALIAMVDCESCNLHDRDQAVWALGQLGDTRALPVLQKYCTGKECDHLKNLCQYKLQIALRHLRHEDNNASESIFWHWMLPDES